MAQLILKHDLRFESLAEVLRLFFADVRRPDEASSGVLEFAAFPDLRLSQELTSKGVILTKGDNGSLVFKTKRQVPTKERRKEAKRQLYLGLAALTGQEAPWGSLTGVRPTQLVESLLEEEKDFERVRERLLFDYGLCREKASLVLQTNQEEQALLRVMDPLSDMVYIGIPFCPSRCSYCSFIAQDATRYQKKLSDYVQAMIREMEVFFATRTRPIQALYFGGGTPSALPHKDLERLLDFVFTKLQLKANCEVTYEAGRADSLDPEKVALFKRYPIQRVCLNPQTLHNETLLRIGRHHTVEQFYEAYAWLNEADFDIINMDLICGLPGEDGQDFLKSVAGVLALNPANITLHSLALKRSARLRHEVKRVPQSPDFKAANEEEEKLLLRARDLFLAMEEAQGLLKSKGYRPYYLYRQKNLTAGLENTGFALPGTESWYNVGMMSDRISVVGIGAGASSKAVFGRRLERYVNVKDIGLYIERAELEAEKKLRLFEL